MAEQINCIGLSKIYGGTRALDKLDLSLEVEQSTGIVGPNGAGKSTLFSILCGFTRPSSGKAFVLGHSPYSANNKGKVSLLPQDTNMYKAIPVTTQLKHYARLSGFNKKDAIKEVERVIELVSAKEFSKQYPETLSFGQRKRVMLAQALIGNPNLILMDEPTSGLDPVAATEVRGILRQLKSEQSLVISSHNLTEIEDICRDIVILGKGKLIQHSNIDEITRSSQCFKLRLDTPNTSELNNIISNIQGVTGIENDSRDDQTYQIYFQDIPAEQLQIAILSSLSEKGISVNELKKGKVLADEIAEILKSNN